MVNKTLRIFIIIVGILIGPGIAYAAMMISGFFIGTPVTDILEQWVIFLIYLGSAVISGLIFIFSSQKLADSITNAISSVAKGAKKTSAAKITAAVIGLIIGLVIACLLSLLIGKIPSGWVSVPLMIICYIVFAALGWSLGYNGAFDLSTVTGRASREKRAGGVPRILDTSAIIDGRIYDISKTGIFDGPLIVPGFVLTELQHISDSADSLKRQKGRRGLDIISRMQEDFPQLIRISDKDYEDVTEVDAKLIRLAVDMKAHVVTLDYNLNMVARVYNVHVFNINELANAVKPVLLPGEELHVIIVKDGKEQGQGVAYLDDGTMIVVDGASGCAGEEKNVAVTSVLQTAAGRMIFAKAV